MAECKDMVNTPNMEAVSAIPGNIGIVRSKVMIWDHDPFMARALQKLRFTFSSSTAQDVGGRAPQAAFQFGSVFLKPIFDIHDTFVATIFPSRSARDKFLFEASVMAPDNEDLDFVGSNKSGRGIIAQPRLPGGKEYRLKGLDEGKDGAVRPDPTIGKDIFPHQLWIFVGSLLKRRVGWHPSEYESEASSVISLQEESDIPELRFTLEEIQSSPKWDYRQVEFNGRIAYWPEQISKQSPDLQSPTHWTLEKYTPVWQGEDFFVIITKGNRDPDHSPARVKTTNEDEIIPEKTVGWNDHYLPLMYDPPDVPSDWITGISNEAYYVSPDDIPESDDEDRVLEDTGRKLYAWTNKSYILIELGAQHPFHNYFIELASGRNPRFIHMGEEWDHPKRLETSKLDASLWAYIRKSRVLSEFGGTTSDSLLAQDSLRVSVRHHLGRLVITFTGFEDRPWVIERFDNDKTKTNFSKNIVPVLVPPGKIRIHGGNISCAIGFAPTRYASEANIPFDNLQADTFEDSTSEDVNEMLYLTFAHAGNSRRYVNADVKEEFFDDHRFDFERRGYDCDAIVVSEYNKNVIKRLGLYEEYHRQYRLYGKGWVFNQDIDTDGVAARDKDGSFIPAGKENVFFGTSGTAGTIFSFATAGHKKARPFVASIENAAEPTMPFKFGLEDDVTEAGYPYPEYVSKWDVKIRLNAGTAEVEKLAAGSISENEGGTEGVANTVSPTAVDNNTDHAFFRDVGTPIVPSWELVVLPGGKPFEGKVEPFDISDLVSSLNDSWTAEDFVSINHEAKLSCYIPVGVPAGGDSSFPQAPHAAESNKPPFNMNPTGTSNKNLYALGQRLLKLHKQSFYVTISYWWELGIGERDVIGNVIDRDEHPYDSLLLTQMTGIAYGAQLEKSINKLYMNFTVKDYMSPLRHQKIFNSPFFDGVQDSLAVYIIAKMAGFDDDPDPDDSSKIDRRPLGYLRKVLQETEHNAEAKFFWNGEETRNFLYDLPGSYADLAQPKMRFQNGEDYEAILKKLAALSSKVVYFDRWGVLKFENLPAIIAAFKTKDDREEFKPVFDFVTSPFPIKNQAPEVGGSEFGLERSEFFEFDPNQHASHLVYNVVRYTRSVEDAINQIVLLTASNDLLLPDGSRGGGFIVEGFTFFEQIWNPESEGFFGYRKPFYQAEGSFGDLQGIRRVMAHYAKMKFPPATISFETFGVPGLKALDIISLDDNLFYITDIAHELDPSTNNWWMNITGEWLKPFLGDLGFLAERGDQASGDAPDGGDEGDEG